MASHGLVRSARQCRQIWRARSLLSYAPFEGEISPQKLLDQLRGAAVYLPKITQFRNCKMQFYAAKRCTTSNRFGISEPMAFSPPVFANQIDVILLPLVGFDRRGNRIGMGAGYYDRALQALAHQPSTKPLLIGLAHSFQEVDDIQPKPWDIPLDAILTDVEYIPISSTLI